MIHANDKYNPRIQDAEGIIPDDEPVFLIRGQDPAAADAVRAYIKLAEASGAEDALVVGCQNHIKLIEQWHVEHADEIHPADL